MFSSFAGKMAKAPNHFITFFLNFTRLSTLITSLFHVFYASIHVRKLGKKILLVRKENLLHGPQVIRFYMYLQTIGYLRAHN
jgi:hypothetical protein